MAFLWCCCSTCLRTSAWQALQSTGPCVFLYATVEMPVTSWNDLSRSTTFLFIAADRMTAKVDFPAPRTPMRAMDESVANRGRAVPRREPSVGVGTSDSQSHQRCPVMAVKLQGRRLRLGQSVLAWRCMELSTHLWWLRSIQGPQTLSGCSAPACWMHRVGEPPVSRVVLAAGHPGRP